MSKNEGADVEAGDFVRVTMRTEPGSQRAVQQFEGEVRKVRERGMSKTQIVDIGLAFGVANSVSVPAYKAEFEVLER